MTDSTQTQTPAIFDRIDSLTDQQRRDALIYLTGYANDETVTKAIDYVTTSLLTT